MSHTGGRGVRGPSSPKTKNLEGFETKSLQLCAVLDYSVARPRPGKPLVRGAAQTPRARAAIHGWKALHDVLHADKGPRRSIADK
eukprot:5842455-Prymnesium_polylepis.1